MKTTPLYTNMAVPAPPPGKASNWQILAGFIGGALLISVLLSSCSAAEPPATAIPTSANTATPANTATSTNTPPPTFTPTITPIPEEIVDGAGHVMRYVPAGEFTMGIDGELEKEICPGLATNQTCINIARGGYSSVHPVYLDAYYMDVYEVTVAQFVEFLNEVGNEGVSEGHITSWPEVIVGPVPWVRIQAEHPFENDILEEDGVFSVPEGFDNHPVEVTWYGAQAYCEWRGALLPTEAQWEKAARGTDGRIFPWGDDFIVTYANVREPNEDGHQYTAPIGSFPEGASPYGMLDMAGNVWEWVADWYWDYDFSLYENPIGPEEPVTDYLGNLHPVRVVRGGDYGQEAFLANSTYRYYYEPGYEWSGFGFRCASPTLLP